MVDIPAEIIAERFGQNAGGFGLGHDHVMFKAFAADVMHEVLEARNFGDGAVAEGVERIIGQFAFAHVRANFALGIGGGEPAEGERSARC